MKSRCCQDFGVGSGKNPFLPLGGKERGAREVKDTQVESTRVLESKLVKERRGACYVSLHNFLFACGIFAFLHLFTYSFPEH